MPSTHTNSVMTTLTTSFLLPLVCLNCIRVLKVVQGQIAAGETTWLVNTSPTPSIGGAPAAPATTASVPAPATPGTSAFLPAVNVSNVTDYIASSTIMMTDIVSETAATTTLAAEGTSPGTTTDISVTTTTLSAIAGASQNTATSTIVQSAAGTAAASSQTSEAAASNSLIVASASTALGSSSNLLDANSSSGTYADSSNTTISSSWQPSLSTIASDIMSATADTTTLAAEGTSPRTTTDISATTTTRSAIADASQNTATGTIVQSAAGTAAASTQTSEAAASNSLIVAPASTALGSSSNLLDANSSSGTYADSSNTTISSSWQPLLSTIAAASRPSSDAVPVEHLPASTPLAIGAAGAGSSIGTASSALAVGGTSLWWLSLLALSFVAVLTTLIAIAAVYKRIQQQRLRLMNDSSMENAWVQNGYARSRPGPGLKTVITFENSAYDAEGESRF